MLNLLMMVLAEGTDLQGGPWGELTVGGILMAGLIVVWRVNTKMAQQNEALHVRIAAIQEQRAQDAKGEIKALTDAQNATAQAMNGVTAAVQNNNRLLERLLDEKSKPN